MSGIKQSILDVMTQLSTINVITADLSTGPLYVRIWNNQIQLLKDGKGYVFQRPAAFVEVIPNPNYEVIGLGFLSADLGFRIHLVHDYYNQEGTFEQDLTIFDLRDKVIRCLAQFVPSMCGAMNTVGENQETGHDNIYHYTIDYKVNFIETLNSNYDPANNKITEFTNPDLTPSIGKDGIPTIAREETPYIIPKKQ